MYRDILLLQDQAQEQELRFLSIISVDKSQFKRGKYRSEAVSDTFKIPNIR